MKTILIDNKEDKVAISNNGKHVVFDVQTFLQIEKLDIVDDANHYKDIPSALLRYVNKVETYLALNLQEKKSEINKLKGELQSWDNYTSQAMDKGSDVETLYPEIFAKRLSNRAKINKLEIEISKL